MKNLFFLFFLVPSIVFAFEIHYNWEEGKTYRYKSETQSEFFYAHTLQMKYMSAETFYTSSEFEISVTKIDENELVHAVLILTRFEIVTDKNKRIGALFQVPKNALTTKITISKYGEFIVNEKFQLALTHKAHYLIKESEINEKPANQIELVSYSQFSLKDGNTIKGEGLNQVAKRVMVKPSIQDVYIDLMPYAYLRLFVLPQNKVKKGASFVTVNKDYNTLITTNNIYKDKIMFSSVLAKRRNPTHNSTQIASYFDYPTETINTTMLFDFEARNTLLSIKGTHTKKQSQPNVAKELREGAKLVFVGIK